MCCMCLCVVCETLHFLFHNMMKWQAKSSVTRVAQTGAAAVLGTVLTHFLYAQTAGRRLTLSPSDHAYSVTQKKNTSFLNPCVHLLFLMFVFTFNKMMNTNMHTCGNRGQLTSSALGSTLGGLRALFKGPQWHLHLPHLLKPKFLRSVQTAWACSLISPWHPRSNTWYTGDLRHIPLAPVYNCRYIQLVVSYKCHRPQTLVRFHPLLGLQFTTGYAVS